MAHTMDFKLSRETVERIREDLREGLCDDLREQFRHEIETVPLFVQLALNDDQLLVGIEATADVVGPADVPPLHPRTLACTAIFIGEESHYVRFVSGDYSVWIKGPQT